MGWWSAYFFAKLLLFAGGYINFDVWWNLLFAVFTALPARNDRQKFTKDIIASVLSVVLLYHDSWLPPLGRVLSQAGALSDFTLPYLMELLGRFFNLKVVLQLNIMLAIYALLKRKLRMATFVFIGIFAVMLGPLFAQRVQAIGRSDTNAMVTSRAASTDVQPDIRTLSAGALNQQLKDFYAQEQHRQVRFSHVAADGAPYDIIILHVCSLSWDDLDDTGKRNDPLLQRFNVTFTHFNSAASYSGPAAIRLLRGNCGQTEHKSLYDTASPDCFVLDGLQAAGFVPQWLMNHDGHFGNFFADVRDRGGMPVRPEDNSGAGVEQRSFDGTPIYDDYSVLSRWWQKRQQNPAEHVVLYYNTISLHDGNKLESNGSSDYAQRFDLFARDLNHFMDDVQRSGRHVIVIVIPEHGAALRGDRRQIQGLREIPTAAITHVPVGVTLINASVQSPINVDVPISYLAVNEVLSRFIADNPFAKPSVVLDSYVSSLPQTESIAENEGTVVLSQGQQAMMRTPDGAWSAWDSRM